MASREEIQKLAVAIATDLCREDPPVVRGEMSKVAAAVANAIAANFAEEARIEREVEETLQAMGRQAADLDPAKLRRGVRERIARQKGFVL
ncbi:MAG TPA: hypothetical protein VEC57_03870 [Candidatus Limnocylindrales bacterium]|nr:hypothetical protein [Candidatus Limnocylindrales bacterium]